MFNPCFPLQRAYLLVLCWVNLFPSISSKHLNCYVSFIHMLIRLIMFTILLVLYNAFVRRNIFLKAFYECKSLFCWAYSLCYISSTSILPVLRYGLPNHNNNTTKNSTKIIWGITSSKYYREPEIKVTLLWFTTVSAWCLSIKVAVYKIQLIWL
jgi:hypothetical protein